MKSLLACVILGVSTLGVVATGCQSKQEKDVTTTGRSQYAYTSADVPTATNAAKDVLNELGLKNVQGDASQVDGKVTGEKANGTDVRVWLIRQKEDNTTKIEVTVGLVGGPSLGAEIAQKIKDRSEGRTTSDGTRSATTMRSTM